MVAKFEVGKIYITYQGDFAYVVLKREGKSVWFWDLINQDQVFRRTVRRDDWADYEEANANVFTVNGYIDRNYVIDANKPKKPDYISKYIHFINNMKKEYIERIAQQVNKFGPYIVNGQVNRKMIR